MATAVRGRPATVGFGHNGVDLNGPAAEVVLAVMAWAAKMERLAINERIAAARGRLAAEGRAWGRPPRLTSGDRKRIDQLRRAGHSIREIAVALKIPRSTVARAAYAGRSHLATVLQPPECLELSSGVCFESNSSGPLFGSRQFRRHYNESTRGPFTGSSSVPPRLLRKRRIQHIARCAVDDHAIASP